MMKKPMHVRRFLQLIQFPSRFNPEGGYPSSLNDFFAFQKVHRCQGSHVRSYVNKTTYNNSNTSYVVLHNMFQLSINNSTIKVHIIANHIMWRSMRLTRVSSLVSRASLEQIRNSMSSPVHCGSVV